MDPDQRQQHILDVLQQDGRVNVAAVAGHFKVTQMTIRRDLADLERKGLLVKRYGGAVSSAAADRFFSFAEKIGRHKQEKEAIASKAAELVAEQETIFLDCGSTPYQIALKLIGRKNLRVVTNSLPIVSLLMAHPGIRITLLGGEILNDRRASYGRYTEAMLAQCRADKAFIGADGVSLAGGISAYDEREGLVSRKMAEQAREVYLVCDSSKLERDSFFPFLGLDNVTGIITDGQADPALVERYRQAKINLIIA